MASSPDYTAPPLPADIKAYLVLAGFWPPDATQAELSAEASVQAQVGIYAAVSELEKRSGWIPLVPSAGAVATTRTFRDGTDENGVLDLRGGLLSLSSVVVGGHTYVIDDEVFANPENAAAFGEPITELEFTIAVGQKVEVTGIWGKYSVWPPETWKAVQEKSAANIIFGMFDQPVIAQITQGPFSHEFDQVGLMIPKDRAVEWNTTFEKAVQREMRVIA